MKFKHRYQNQSKYVCMMKVTHNNKDKNTAATLYMDRGRQNVGRGKRKTVPHATAVAPQAFSCFGKAHSAAKARPRLPITHYQIYP